MNALTRDLIKLVDMTEEMMKEKEQKEGTAYREYYNNYQRYQLMQVDKERVIMACNIIINDLIGRLYRYDYRFGYDITLASEHSIAKKLSDNWQNEWEVEDYEAGDC